MFLSRKKYNDMKYKLGYVKHMLDVEGKVNIKLVDENLILKNNKDNKITELEKTLDNRIKTTNELIKNFGSILKGKKQKQAFEKFVTSFYDGSKVDKSEKTCYNISEVKDD